MPVFWALVTVAVPDFGSARPVADDALIAERERHHVAGDQAGRQVQDDERLLALEFLLVALEVTEEARRQVGRERAARARCHPPRRHDRQ